MRSVRLANTLDECLVASTVMIVLVVDSCHTLLLWAEKTFPLLLGCTANTNANSIPSNSMLNRIKDLKP